MTTPDKSRPMQRRAAPFWVAVLLIVAVLASACGGRRNATPTGGEILAQYLPAGWTPLTGSNGENAFQPITIDDDKDNEWLLLFRYDSPEGATVGPIGGIIYDVQQNSDPYNPAVVIPFPYQPMAFFIPYRLLPDWTPGKGQGYLGDSNATLETTKLTKGQEQADELLVKGTSSSGRVTRVSIFRWEDKTKGYSVAYFQGSYNATTEADRKEGDAVRQVVTMNTLNDRSALCERVVWTRQADSITFTGSAPAIVFCLGAPGQPMYPEAVVLAYLLTQNTDLILPDPDPNTTPDSVSRVKSAVPAPISRVVTLVYPGAATVIGTGASAKSRMIVETTVESGGGQSRILWTLEEQRSNPEDRTTRWRILSAEKG